MFMGFENGTEKKENTSIEKSIWKAVVVLKTQTLCISFSVSHFDVKTFGIFFLSVDCQCHFFIAASLCFNANVFFFSVANFNVSVPFEIADWLTTIAIRSPPPVWPNTGETGSIDDLSYRLYIKRICDIGHFVFTGPEISCHASRWW